MDKKMIQIPHRLSMAVLFEAAVDSVKAAVELAVKQGVNLACARLDGASLDGASLVRARLDGASLDGASLPAPTVVLLASWGAVSPELCADLMVWDASNHPDSTKFDAWAKGGDCPYIGVRVQRAAYFQEKNDLWGKGELCRPYDLMVRVLAEKCPEWTAEQKKEFEEEICKPLQVGDKVIPREFEGGPGMNDYMRAMCGSEATITAVGTYYTIGGWSRAFHDEITANRRCT